MKQKDINIQYIASIGKHELRILHNFLEMLIQFQYAVSTTGSLVKGLTFIQLNVAYLRFSLCFPLPVCYSLFILFFLALFLSSSLTPPFPSSSLTPHVSSKQCAYSAMIFCLTFTQNNGSNQLGIEPSEPY